MNRDQLLADLARDEGFRPVLYDDATGKPWTRDLSIKGRLTIGIGWCLETDPLLYDQALILLGMKADDKWESFLKLEPWVVTLSEPVQRALANMAYQLGAKGLSKFNTFLGLLQTAQFGKAADDLKTTPWYKQSGERAERIEAIIRQVAS